jgi:Lrp/AsnC family leucine-responsive transcriptional regulator
MISTSPDKTSMAILRILQEDGRTTINELADRVGLSASAVARRVRLLEEARIISG